MQPLRAASGAGDQSDECIRTRLRGMPCDARLHKRHRLCRRHLLHLAARLPIMVSAYQRCPPTNYGARLPTYGARLPTYRARLPINDTPPQGLLGLPSSSLESRAILDHRRKQRRAFYVPSPLRVCLRGECERHIVLRFPPVAPSRRGSEEKAFKYNQTWSIIAVRMLMLCSSCARARSRLVSCGCACALQGTYACTVYA